ncbi:hypothetical protein [Rhodoferax ferrireducens]|uniref:hypothetical protein n=1 Tax=Rhodoferax ferrireducens TaxID=192843 RepID=UPI000E0D0109|nr:hypothetical protein [Rhodoferax ferrireducens]
MSPAFKHLWGWPLVLGLLTTSALLSALVSDGGGGDIWSWFGLGLPVAVMLWFALVPRRAACNPSAPEKNPEAAPDAAPLSQSIPHEHNPENTPQIYEK